MKAKNGLKKMTMTKGNLLHLQWDWCLGIERNIIWSRNIGDPSLIVRSCNSHILQDNPEFMSNKIL